MCIYRKRLLLEIIEMLIRILGIPVYGVSVINA